MTRNLSRRLLLGGIAGAAAAGGAISNSLLRQQGSFNAAEEPCPEPPPANPPAPSPAPSEPQPQPSSFEAGAPPGGGWTGVHWSTSTPFPLPPNFVGWHRAGSLPAAPYPYSLSRSLDWTVDDNMPIAYWAYIQRQGRGAFDWSGVDRWIQLNRSANAQRKLIWTLFQTPTWASLAPDNNGLPELYPALKGGSQPPANWDDLRTFLRAFKQRYSPAVIPFFEVWNEPDTFNHSDPNARNTDASRGQFWRGNMYELVKMHHVVREIINDRPVLSGGWNSVKNFTLFTSVATDGKRPLDSVERVSFHSYMYEYNPQIAYSEARAYREAINAAADRHARAAWKNLPLHNTEMGHEYRPASETSLSVVVRNMKQAVGFNIAAAISYRNRGVVFYADNKNPRTFQGPLHTKPELVNAAKYCAQVEGKIVRQVQIKPDGGEPAVWIRFEDNTEFLG